MDLAVQLCSTRLHPLHRHHKEVPGYGGHFICWFTVPVLIFKELLAVLSFGELGTDGKQTTLEVLELKQCSTVKSNAVQYSWVQLHDLCFRQAQPKYDFSPTQIAPRPCVMSTF